MLALAAGGINAGMRKLAAAAIVLVTNLANAEAPKRKARIGYQAPVITGTFDAKAVTATIKRGHAKYIACYEAGRKANADLRGPVNATFTIAADGTVTNVHVSGLVADTDACIAAVIAKLKFTTPKSAVEVTVPMTFGTIGGAFGSPAIGDVNNGSDEDKNMIGGLLGNEPGEMQGGFGFGRSGFGPGGGGTGWGTIGTGRYGQIGSGSGTGSGYGVGGGRGGMRGRAAAVPGISIGQPNVVGDLDKAIIRRYIKRNIQKLLYCYEKALLATPGLEGTVLTDFTIGIDGLVLQSNASGVSSEVAACVQGVIKGIEFPKPKAGDVKVNYPFTYRLPDPAPATTPPATNTTNPPSTTNPPPAATNRAK